QKMFNHPNCENYFQIKRGINISHWLSQNPDKNSNRNRLFTVEDAALISRLGYDHVRIPVDEEHLWDEQGNRLESSFEMLHEGIKWCLENDLKIILDLHQIRSHSFNSRNNLLWKSAKAQNEFIQMWLLLSGEFSKYPVEDLAYELLNEAVADSSSQWNRLLKTTIDSIRKREPYRKIIFGSNKWQTPKTFHELVVPENDSNIILSFHFYAPHAFTHYRAHWLEAGKYIGPVNYPGQVIEPENLTGYPENVLKGINQSNGYYTKDTLLGNIQEPLLYAKEHRLQLYCGEFGCVPFVPRTMRLQWYKDVREMFEMNGIAWSNWDYKGLFGIFNSGNGNPDQYLMDVLIPE
ncbi:MAG TPA: cellulase family glycosylhydrolase, partial [Prolixibacteraceae bacterium]|nr:cellulase family glycosylhydrolase [Prolixibacteraceae bacterium]